MDAVEKAKLRSFLESWQDEELSFRSSILFSETTFAQAKGTKLCNTQAGFAAC